ncbi:hypothetical protein ZHAS_00015410 [Anopheles sinensis]|uniref:Uncharacterized protein n=1 Tax=Anopheles sinensis TaxID=74873 RepID=A0A084WB67_ANOSI|nr:hypothetical protein ZHAS_00015410 [Anopheles sinensis]
MIRGDRKQLNTPRNAYLELPCGAGDQFFQRDANGGGSVNVRCRIWLRQTSLGKGEDVTAIPKLPKTKEKRERNWRSPRGGGGGGMAPENRYLVDRGPRTG